MTTFTSTDIPNDITTIEQLYVWCASILADVNQGQTIQIETRRSEYVTTLSPFLLTTGTTPQWHLAIASYPLLQNTWQRGNTSLWLATNEFSAATIPEEYKI